MIKVAVFLTAFYLVYYFLLKNDTTYVRNRIFIILSILLSFIFPFINLHTSKPLDIQVFGRLLSEVLVNDGKMPAGQHLTLAIVIKNIYYIYIIVAFISLIKVIADIANIFTLIIQNQEGDSRIIRFKGLNTSGFSAIGFIFINSRLSDEDAEEIIKHEQNHLKQFHFLDILFVEIVKVFQWFNPFVYFFNRSLRAIHEYQADRDCLSSGVPVTSYQSLLLNQIFKSKVFGLSSSFSNPSLVRQRLIMMNKKRTTAVANIKLLVTIPITAVVLLAVSAYRDIPTAITHTQQTLNQLSGYEMMLPPPPPPPPPPSEKIITDKDYSPFVVVEEMPMFPGGDAELLKFIAQNTVYPENAKLNNVQGKVIVRFCVTETGNVALATVLKGVDPELDQEALRVVNILPAFKPGKQGGKDVPVWYMVPISFTLR
jgi:TonB family protein